MKKSLLATAAAVAFIAAPGFALAQKQEAPASKSEAASPAPKAMQNAPADKSAPANQIAPNNRAEGNKAPATTTGQASPKMDDGKSNAQMKPDTKSDSKATTTGQAAPKADDKTRANAKDDGKAGMKASDTKNPAAKASDTKAEGTKADGTKAEGTKAQNGSSTTAQGSAGSQGASVSLSTEQKTKIRTTVLQGSNAPRVSNVNFSISVGTVVPRTVNVVTVPSTLVEIHPAWRGYMYFVHGDEIIIVEPRSLQIVAVIVV